MSSGASDPSQAVLPTAAVADIARAVVTQSGVWCPDCQRDVSESRKAHRVRRSNLSDRVFVDAHVDEVPVFGWRCDYCAHVLALDPATPHDDLGPGAGWIAVDATLASGESGPVLVPREVVLA